MIENIIVLVIAVGIGAWWYENYGPNEESEEAGNTINLEKSEKSK